MKKSTADEEKKQDVEMKLEAEDSDDVDVKDQGNQKYHVFENDDFEQTITDAVWFSKNMPKRRRADKLAGKKESAIGLDALKIQLLEIETLYSSTMGSLSREWESPAVRLQILNALEETENVEEFYKLLERIEQGISDPF